MKSYKYILFEIIKTNKDKILGYAILDNNCNNLDNHISYVNLIELLINLKFVKLEINKINIIQELYGDIKNDYYRYFQIIIDQRKDLLFEFESDDNYNYFTSNDYDDDEYEYIYNSKIFNNENTEFDFEKSIEFDFNEKVSKYNIDLFVSELNYTLEDYDLTYWKDNKEIIMSEFNMNENDYSAELNKISKINKIAKKIIEQINMLKKHFTKEFIKSKMTDAENKINFYSDIFSNPNKNININNIKLKIANQICRKFKYENLEKIKFNFIVTNYDIKQTDDSTISYYIKISNSDNSIIGLYEKKQFGNSNSGFLTEISYSLTGPDNNDNIIENDVLGELFTKLSNFLF